MEEIYGKPVMEQFYSWYGIRRGNMAGGCSFNGPNLKNLLKLFILSELEKLLGDSSRVWVDYLHSIREMHAMCSRRELAPDYSYEEVVAQFDACFEAVHVLGVSDTPKRHILSCHVLEYLNYEGVTMYSTTDEAVEAVHQVYKRREEVHRLKMTKDVSSHLKKQKSFRTIVLHNSLNK